MSMPSYSRYRLANPLFGSVPEHWHVVRLKNVLRDRIADGPHVTPEFIDEGVPFLSVDGIQDGELQFDGCRYISERDHAQYRQKVAPKRGDLLMGKAASTGKIARVKVDFEFSIWSPLALIRVDHALAIAGYVEYALKCPIAQAQIDNLCTSNTQKNISMDDIPRLVLTLPPLGEQIAITAFLDHEIAKIDALVDEQKHLIELLREKRQAVISQAVTKGLDPSVPMKDSGVEWLGRVPAHWQTSRLANLFSDTDERGTEELPVLTVSIHHGVSDDELDEDDLDRKVTRSDDKTKYKRVAPGDLVYNMMRAWQGGFGSVTVDGMVSPAYVVARPRTDFPTSFIERVLRTPNAVEEMRGRSRGVTDFRLRLYWEEFKDIVVPLPPKHEVEAIIAHLDESDRAMSNTIYAAEDCIAILRERRSALISAAVTGKIDVRGLVPQPEATAA